MGALVDEELERLDRQRRVRKAERAAKWQQRRQSIAVVFTWIFANVVLYMLAAAVYTGSPGGQNNTTVFAWMPSWGAFQIAVNVLGIAAIEATRD